MTANYIEILLWTLFDQVFGNPVVMGLFLMLFLIALGISLRLGIEGFLVFFIPAMLFVFTTIEIFTPLKILMGLILGIILGMTLLRIIKR